MARALTTDEITTIQAMPRARGTASRFTADGRGFNPITGASAARGTNVIHQTVYWDLSREAAQTIAALTGARLTFEVDDDADEREAVRQRQIAEHRETVKATGAVCRCGNCR